ncbi:hypothetical protein EDD16DRAFT_1703538 [Pisolithus croceorrhizus]|nr:hypothetical protein EDD16DRAFT_1703538 [Pisolithus croceorrhizus]KAI6130064.1 hypothetical protein EV401DRAFT_2066354 [Pisolithus croceorrhizus]KAI6160455.1 hypothetical protein EDD17DRAFT_1761029 [Pisolithus thermaeus]
MGLHEQAGGQSSVQAANTTTVLMEITTDAPSPPHMPAIPQDDKIMNSPSAPSNHGDAPMHSPPPTFDMSGQVEESTMAPPPCPKSQVSPGHGRAIHHVPGTWSFFHVMSSYTSQSEDTGIADVRVEPHFIHHSYLDSIDLVVNAEFHFLACQTCKEGITTTAGWAHLVNKHPELLSTFDQGHFDMITSQLQVTTSLLTITGPRPKVHGLEVFDAMACSFCSMVYTKQKMMKEHHGLQHCHIPIPQHWQSCKAQCMKLEGAGTLHQLWEVTMEAREGEDSREKVLVDELLKELGEQLNTMQVPTDG